MRIYRAAPLLAAGLAVAVASPAFAAPFIQYADGTYSYVGDDGVADNLSVTCVAGDVAPMPTFPAVAVACADIEHVDVDTATGDDTVDLSGLTPAAFPALASVQIQAEEDWPDVDHITGSPRNDFVDADIQDTVAALAGDDVIDDGDEVDGGAGNDVLFGVVGKASGGSGDDRFVQTLATDGNDGGPGYDSIELDFDRTGYGLPGVSLTLTPAQLLATAPGLGSQSVFVTGFEEGYFTLPRGGGTQTLNAARFPGSAHVRGSFGRDVITGTRLDDVLKGRNGNDTIDARDGKFDLIDCGAGTDTAMVDPSDHVTGCEVLRYTPPSTSRITGPKKVEKGASASYKFGSNVPGSVFQCRIDKQKWKSCASPYRVVASRKLKPGKHQLFVRAGYPKGNWDRTPSKRAFTVIR